MAKVFYIAGDEEITSVIDKFRSSSVKEIIFVVPPRALVLQSIVNLKLLKREADKLKRKIILVTKDENGRSLAQKVNILVVQSLDELSTLVKKNAIKAQIKKNKSLAKVVALQNNSQQSKNRLEELGSDKFFLQPARKKINKIIKNNSDVNNSVTKKNIVPRKTIEKEREKIVKKTNNQKKKIIDFWRITTRKKDKTLQPKEKEKSKERNEQKLHSKFSSNHTKELEEIFSKRISQSNSQSQEKTSSFNSQLKIKTGAKKYQKNKVSLKAKLWLGGLSLFLVALSVFLFVYLWLPKALVKIDLKSYEKEVELITQSSIKPVNDEIPMRIIEGEEEITKNYLASGKSKIADKKARGVVTIYNQSSKKQPLIATTRIMTKDGKVFRLIKNVMVPSKNKDNSPGEVIVGVVADKAGEDFNIGPSKFTIPGLEGSPIYKDIYAKSDSNMIGGGGETEMKVVLASDIKEAQDKTLRQLIDKIVSKEKVKIKKNEDFTKDMLQYDIIENFAFPSEGMITKSFSYKIKVKYKLAVFDEEILKKEIIKKAQDFIKNKNNIEWTIKVKEINFGKNDCDYNKNVCLIKANGKISFDTVFDKDKFKKEILGKNESDLQGIIKKYPQIQKIKIEFSPKYLPIKIPLYSKKVELIVK